MSSAEREIEVTPEMIEAGATVFACSDYGSEFSNITIRDVLPEVYLAMRAAFPSPSDAAPAASDALADQLAKAEARCGELVEALAKAEYIADDRGREHTAAFMDAPKGDRGHATAAAACAHVAEAIKALARTLQADRATWPDRAAKALAPAPNGEKGADA